MERQSVTSRRIIDPSPEERASGFAISVTPASLTEGMDGPITAIDIVPTGTAKVLRDVTIRLTGEQLYLLGRILDSFDWDAAEQNGLGNFGVLAQQLREHEREPDSAALADIDVWAPQL